jgi:hypothetical protein
MQKSINQQIKQNDLEIIEAGKNEQSTHIIFNSEIYNAMFTFLFDFVSLYDNSSLHQIIFFDLEKCAVLLYAFMNEEDFFLTRENLSLLNLFVNFHSKLRFYKFSTLKSIKKLKYFHLARVALFFI